MCQERVHWQGFCDASAILDEVSNLSKAKVYSSSLQTLPEQSTTVAQSLFVVLLQKDCPLAMRHARLSLFHTQLGQLSCTFSPKDGKEINRLYLSEELPLLNAYSWKIYLQSPKTADPGFFQPDYYVFSPLSPSKDDQRKASLNSGVGRNQIMQWKQSQEVGVKIQYPN